MLTDLEDELHIYRAHRSQIIRLESAPALFAVFTPRGELLASGTIEEVAPYILTGPEDYTLCVDNWIGRGRPTAASHDLLATLGLLPTTPAPQPIKRRI